MGFIEQINGPGNPALLLAAGLVSRAAEIGDVCLDLKAIAGRPLSELIETTESGLMLPQWAQWRTDLENSSVVGGPGDWTPLVLDRQGRLYLHRLFDFEQNLAIQLVRRSQQTVETIDAAKLRKSLFRYFPNAGAGSPDWQRVAAVSAAMGGLTVISGGPGTGKTWAIGRILAVIAEQSPQKPPRTLLATPTGKAAARLGDALRESWEALPVSSAVRRALPTQASTIHRLLKIRSRGQKSTHDDGRWLPADLVFIDEASMVDLALMARLINAIPDTSRLVILGDRDQLASVEAGSVFGDLCHPGAGERYTTAFAEKYRKMTGETLETSVIEGSTEAPLLNAITVLRKNHRFGDTGMIGRLSREIASGNTEAVLELLARKEPGVEWLRPEDTSLAGMLTGKIPAAYRDLVNTDHPETALAALDRFRVLCPLRRGPFGVEMVNNLVESILREHYRMRGRESGFTSRPVMITRNDYSTRLFNGDCGIALSRPRSGDADLRVWFQSPEGTPRAFHLARIPEHETVFAMTVHKSQGSEYDEIIVVLPEEDSPVLSRELLYTAVTRARHRVTLWGGERVIRRMVNRKIKRSSGLRERLWPNPKIFDRH